jgi:hypothetical protein
MEKELHHCHSCGSKIPSSKPHYRPNSDAVIASFDDAVCCSDACVDKLILDYLHANGHPFVQVYSNASEYETYLADVNL